MLALKFGGLFKPPPKTKLYSRKKSETINQPKEEVSLWTSGQKLRSGPPNPEKASTLARTCRADVHEETSV